ncbi:MAG: methyltransferase [Candidatus Zipacnadales bacterium]
MEHPEQVVSNIGDLMDLVTPYWISRAVLSAHEIGLFTALGNETLTAAELARRIGCDARATELLANALCGVGLLDKRGEAYSNGPFAATHLVRGQGEDMCGYLDHHAMLWRRWSELTEAVRLGKVDRGPSEIPPDSIRAFIMAMRASSSHWSGRVADNIDLGGVRRIIDIGGGSGGYAYEILKRASEATAVIFDLPNVVPITRECAELAGVADRVETVAGSYWEDELGEGFDLAIVSNVLHSTGPEGCVTILQKAYRCLVPGGRVVVHDFVLQEDKTRPKFAALFSLNMLCAGSDGRSYTASELREFLRRAEFAETNYIQTSEDTGIVIGTKAR